MTTPSLNLYSDTYKHKGLRKQLVSELAEKGIVAPKVLEAISQLPRHFFLDQEFEDHAYIDKAFPINSGQTISQPYTVAFQSQLLDIKKGDKILEIGTGSGYQAAILNMCGAEVFSIERIEDLHLKSKAIMSFFNLKANLKLGDGTQGWKEFAPFDKIIVTAGTPKIPNILINQLKVGGFIILPYGKNKEVQNMTKITRITETDLKTEVFSQFAFVPLIGKEAWEE